MFRRPRLLATALAIVAVALASRVPAGEGQIDLLLDPVATTTISQPGSYILVADATFSPTNVACLNVTASNVTIDLNGHIITGAGGSSAAGNAITFSGDNLTIRNGTLRNFAGVGVLETVSGKRGVVIEDVIFMDMGLGGVSADGISAARVTSCSFLRAPSAVGYAAWVGDLGVVEDCIIDGTGASPTVAMGISAGKALVARRNTIRGLSASVGFVGGIDCGDGSVVADNRISGLVSTAAGADSYAIQASGLVHDAQVSGNAISDVGSGSVVGIFISRGVVRENTLARLTSSAGRSAAIIATGNARVSGNAIAEVKSTGGQALGILVDRRSMIDANMLNTIAATGGDAAGVSVSATGGLGPASGSAVVDNVIGGVTNTGGVAGLTVSGIQSQARVDVRGNTISGLSASGSGVGIYGVRITGGAGSMVMGNSISDLSGGTTLNLGVFLDAVASRVESNLVDRVAGSVGTTASIRLTASADGSVVVGNRITSNPVRSIVFDVGADGCYFGSNIIENTAISNLGAGNTAGTGDNANVVY